MKQRKLKKVPPADPTEVHVTSIALSSSHPPSCVTIDDIPPPYQHAFNLQGEPLPHHFELSSPGSLRTIFSPDKDDNPIIKIVVCGPFSVGKTCLVHRIVYGTFQEGAQATIGYGVEHRLFSIDNVQYKSQFWDTAGLEKYMAMSMPFMRGASVVLLCFDLSNQLATETLDHWYTMLREHTDTARMFLVGLKKDLPRSEGVVDTATQFAKEFGLEYWEVSASSCENMEDFVKRLYYVAACQYATFDRVFREKFVPLDSHDSSHSCC
eukprot:TRINITY_DN10093_c0_g1_i1.p1 TRINITY_DN10093_c0_g1~~TRINITY_DN10093_c0_g1_i1.p1  ORF type:complete len:266 (+),score=16.92 TRINITY_DN10093_c0_g1_i1:251-1048(+)